ncbi:hypothetical protein SAMN00017405_1681 [Desulfonispora thiosulfatigenes DSM 11270]|uniref:Uncharacterized protein n=1 Tax=Desulfonispora thiosulfatigenes DSM 11270 TaxID=656914 RepID=A0A1W1UXP6_DESTI|nr:hypothetical protein [Desulfonispora thiosulfatigenes]SMB85843.1 hypothetical protein SAMN00017405_1681 [Desulfonispora thiosulfatigenes DSM 11270]
MPWIQIASHKTYNLPEETPNLPFVRLADVEQNPKMIKVHRYYEDDIDFYNKYRSEWSFFAPVQYETDESGKVPGEMWLDGSGEYSPSITSQVYQLRYEFLTEGLISDLIKRYGAWYDGGEFKEIEHPDLDLLIVHEREAAVEIFAGKGKGVIYLRYYGFAEQEKIIENIAQKIFLPSW